MFFLFLCLISASAAELAGKVGGKAISLDELDDFAPEDGMILLNTTSVGMKPKINETPISKVQASPLSCVLFLYFLFMLYLSIVEFHNSKYATLEIF